MSDSVSRFPKGSDDRPGDPPGDPDAATSGIDHGPLPDDGDWLDIEHHARVTRVSACDSARARKHAAEAEIARLVEEEQILRAERQALGGDEHVDAIVHSGWFPYAQPIISSARLAWLLDAVLWTALWLGVWALAARVLTHD
jgi:hypothetical protein